MGELINGTKRKVVILTWNDVSMAYSCLIYLKKSLERFFYVELWSLTPNEVIEKFKDDGYFSFYNNKYWKLRGIRHFIIEHEIYKKIINNPDDIYIINDLKFYKVAYYAKRKNPDIKIIHYNTEIPGRDVKISTCTKEFYKKHANFPDLIIECLKERGNWRKRTYGISKDIYTINNTLPIEILSENHCKPPIDVLKLAKGKPVLLYAGRAGHSRNLQEILECIPHFMDRVFFLFFCYGDNKDIQALYRWGELNRSCDNFSINCAISRGELLKIMECCDIGINYYEPTFSVNHKYAAPSKFFEYIACGMNVISTKNIGIDRIILDNNIGVCIDDGESIKEALERLLQKGLESRENIKSVYLTKYEYSKDASKAISKIVSL